jgi:membrane protease YdiL (CAAX protease family)
MTPFPWTYFALANALSWTCWGIAALFTVDSGPVEGGAEELLAAAPPAALAFILLGVFGPFTAAFFLTWSRDGRDAAAALWKSGWNAKLGLRWFLVALLLFPAIQIGAILSAGVGVSAELFVRPLALLGMTLFMWFLGGSFGEEFGWRGYALPRLLDRFDALSASLVLGAFWVIWHVPLFFIPGSPQAQIPFVPWAISVLALSIIYTWVHVHVGGVVFAALLLHTMGNLSPELFQATDPVPELWRSPDAFNLYATVAVAIVIVAVFGPKKLRRGP